MTSTTTATDYYYALEDKLEAFIQRAQGYRRDHTGDGDRRAYSAMYDAFELIVRQAVRNADLTDTDTALIYVSGNFRRVLSQQLRNLTTASPLVHARRRLNGDHDVLELFGYASEVHLVARFLESVNRQIVATVEYWWLRHAERGRVDLRQSYSYQREKILSLTDMMRRQVRAAYESSTTTMTSNLLRRRHHVLTVTRTDV